MNQEMTYDPPAIRRPLQLSYSREAKPVGVILVDRLEREIARGDGECAIAKCEGYSYVCVARHGPRSVLVLCARDRCVDFRYVLMSL